MGAISDKANAECGVPQGSILGSFLFVLFVNDLPDNRDKFKIFIYADDTGLMFSHPDIKLVPSNNIWRMTLKMLLSGYVTTSYI